MKNTNSNKPKYIAIIPVRGGSKSIPLKNIKPIAGKPLVCWTMEAAIKCEKIEKVYISTDSKEIVKTINSYLGTTKKTNKVEVIDRPKETASDTASTESVLLDFANKKDFENLILIQATSPLLEYEDLSKGIKKFEDENYDSLLTATIQKRFVWEDDKNGAKPKNYDYLNRPRRQDFDGFFVENGAFYITKKDILLENKNRLGGKIGILEMREETNFEIDEPSDWIIIESLLKKQQKQMPLNNIKLVVTDNDGVLTNGGVYYDETGEALKRYNIKDGMGFELLRNKGILTALITGEESSNLKKRAEKIGIDYQYYGIKDKLTTLKELATKIGVSLNNIGYIGDDINDLECIQNAGVTACPNDSEEIIKNHADIVLERKGGEGAFREFANKILENI